jgi:hypothetical protein
VDTLFAREPGDLAIDHDGKRLVRVGKATSRSR